MPRPQHGRGTVHPTLPGSKSPRHPALVAVSAVALLMLALATAVGTGIRVPAAHAMLLDSGTPSASASATDSATASPTSTSTPTTPPSLVLVSPASGKGPVGAHLTVGGSNFAANASVAIYAAAASDCSQQAAGLTTTNANGGGSISSSFVWPIGLNGGTFYICASGITSGAPSYQVISPTAPSISLSVPSIAAGQPLTITGSNFVGLPDGGQVLLAEIDSAGHAITITRVVVGTDGTFTTTWTVTPATGTTTISAVSPQEGNAAPALQATAQLVVTAAGSPTASASVSPTVNSGGTSTGNGNHGNGSGFLLVLVLIVAVLLLIGLGILAFFLLRGRNGPPTDALYGNGGYGPGEYPGFASRNQDTRKVPQLGSTDRHTAPGYDDYSGPHGTSGFTNTPRIGGVAQWDPPEPAPGPDWQPRPMSGRTRDYDPQDATGGFGEGTTNRDRSPAPSEGFAPSEGYPPLDYPPLDPWATHGGATHERRPPPQPGRDSTSGWRGSESDWWGNTTNPAEDDR